MYCKILAVTKLFLNFICKAKKQNKFLFFALHYLQDLFNEGLEIWLVALVCASAFCNQINFLKLFTCTFKAVDMMTMIIQSSNCFCDADESFNLLLTICHSFILLVLTVGAGKEGTCPKPWKGLTGFCDKMGDECGMDYHCSENEKCCFSGCQRMCVNTTEAHQNGASKPGQCPKPWLGQEGLCDRRGDMCQKDVDCKGSQICCFNGCQNDCVNPG